MRVSELAQRADVTIASLKYYIRIGLLPSGAAQSATRAEYDESHLERVRLIRTLAEVGGLSIERIGEVVAALDHPPSSRHALLGTAHHVLRDGNTGPVSDLAWRLVAPLAAPCETGGTGHSPASIALGQAITTAQSAGWAITEDALQGWARALREIARGDVVADLGQVSPAEALRFVVMGNVLTDPILIALRRVEQERLSVDRFSSPEPDVSSTRQVLR